MKIQRILTAAAAILTVCSCEGILDKKPLVTLAVENYYTTEEEVNTAILGVYHVFMTENFGLYHYLHIGDNLSDDSQLGNSRSPGLAWAGNAKSLVKYQILPTNSYSGNNTWNQDFQVITKSNYIIENTEKNNIPNAEKYIAEAKFLRSYVYFDMAAQFGGMPLADHILSYEEYYNPRASMEDTWEFIEKGFRDAADGLPEKWDAANTGRATKGSALAMLARTYIYHASYDGRRETWEKAYDTLLELIEGGYYSLEPVYSDIFDIEHRNGQEIIFSIQFWVTVSGWGDSNDGNMLSFYGRDAGISLTDLNPATTTLDPDTYTWVYETMKKDGVFVDGNGEPTAYPKKMTGWSLHCPTVDLVNAFEEGDPRLDATVIRRGEFYDGFTHFNLSSDSGYQSKKEYCPMAYRSDESNEDNLPVNMIILRYADMLLYMAEACNELDKTDEALRYLEMVRGRARKNASSTDVLPEVTDRNKDVLRERIYHERRVELAMEYNRYYDLARTGRLYDVMSAYYDKYEKDPSSAGYSGQGKGELIVKGTHEHMPIPANAINASSYQGKITLEQNPGY